MIQNKLVVGKMEDETGGVAVEEFIGLRPNMYSFLVDDSGECEWKCCCHHKSWWIQRCFVQ